MGVSVSKVAEADLPAVRRFLREHADTSMFLLSNLSSHGPALSDAMNSGNFKYLSDEGEIPSVFCLTRRANLLAESRGTTMFGPAIVDACKQEQIRIVGAVGE